MAALSDHSMSIILWRTSIGKTGIWKNWEEGDPPHTAIPSKNPNLAP